MIKVRLWRNTFDLDERAWKIRIRSRSRWTARGFSSSPPAARKTSPQMAENPGTFGADLDQRLTVRMPVKAGTHTLSATTVLKSHAQRDHLIKPFMRTTIDGLDITGDPSVDRLTIEGPFGADRAPEIRPSRRKIFTCKPATPARGNGLRAQDPFVARRALPIAGPLDDSDVDTAAGFLRSGPSGQAALTAASNPRFSSFWPARSSCSASKPIRRRLRRRAVYRLDDLALASRLSFFLWSSIPDDQLLTLATQGKLKDPAVLEQQVRRMLADPRSQALIANFAEQWLHPAQPQEHPPGSGGLSRFRRQPAAGDEAGDRRCSSTASCARTAASMDLLNADYTFVNERLARHYGIPNIYGSQFRRVKVPERSAPRAAGAGAAS